MPSKPTTPKHSRLGASGAARWLACPGSVALETRFPDVESPYATEGTAAHRLGEKALLVFAQHRNVPGKDLALALLRSHAGKDLLLENGKSFPVSEEMVEAVEVYVRFVADTCIELGAEISIEEKLHLSWLHPQLFGTADCVLRQPFGKLVVVDYKHGVGVIVPIIDNPQAMFYAVGAMGKPSVVEDFDQVELVVVQPRAMGGDGVKNWETTPEYLRHWSRETLAAGVAATFQRGAKLAAGDHCRFCKASGACPEKAKVSLAVAGEAFKVEELGQRDLRQVHLLSAGEIAKILDHAHLLETWLDDVRTRAHQELTAGQLIPGWKLVSGRSNRQWKDEANAETTLELEMGDVIYTEPKLKSPAQIEATAKKLGHKISVEDLVHQPEGKPTLAPVSDNRPALTGNKPEDVFTKEQING